MVAAFTAPWLFNFITAESRGTIRAVREVLHYGGNKLIRKILKFPKSFFDRGKSVELEP